MQIKSINPSNYQEIDTIAVSDENEIKQKVKQANLAKLGWKNISVKQRVEFLRPIFADFKHQKPRLAEIQAKEMGMPIKDALEDIDDTMHYVDWYFANAEKYLNPEVIQATNSALHTIYREPIGVSAVILPWNFPFSMFVWATLQGLIAGNVVVVKHSEECPLSGKFIENIFATHNLPEGVFSEVYGDGAVGKLLVQQAIDIIQFTGSSTTGKYLYEVAGKRFLKANMELGGSAPGIIFADADLTKNITTVCGLRLFNAGQCCDGLKRLIVHASIADQVQEKIANIFARKRLGNALEPTTELGPLVAKKQLDLLTAQVQDAVTKGAKVLVGGKNLEDELGGAFYQPTLLTDVSTDMRVWQEEVFGPVLPIVTFTTEEEAIWLANDTVYGLGAYIFSEDTARAQRMAQAIDSGVIGINGCSYFVPSSPFGGYKNSGFGREHGKYGFHEVTQIKLVATPVG